CGGRERRGKERPATLALASLEVAVARADGDLAGAELVTVHRDAHRAAGLAPLRAGGTEDLAEALSLRLALHLVAAGHDHHPHAVGDTPPADHLRREPQVADPAVRARPDEHDVDLLAEDRLARAQRHVFERPLQG